MIVQLDMFEGFDNNVMQDNNLYYMGVMVEVIQPKTPAEIIAAVRASERAKKLSAEAMKELEEI